MLLRGFDLRVGVASAQEIAREIGEGFAAGEILELGELVGGEITLQAGEAAGQGGEGVGIRAALGDVFSNSGRVAEGLRLSVWDRSCPARRRRRRPR